MILQKKAEELHKLVGRNLKEHMKAAHMTPQELAKICKMDRHHVYNLFHGRHGMTIRLLVNLCYALEITPNDLLDYHQPIRRKRAPRHMAANG